MPEDRLSRYRQKRDFEKTSEPAGAVARKAPPLARFVVQKHSASRLHYDFRLEMNGVLASWAVPKGPSLDPVDRRLAVHVEDHPLEYFDFEGTIPRGEYGGGTVMVWDWGAVRWLKDDVDDMVARHDIKFELYGRKLKGAFALVGGHDPEQKNWFLIKKRDEGARPGDEVSELDRSVLSGRSMDEIAADAGRVWHSQVDASGQGGGAHRFVDLSAASRAKLPRAPSPMLAHPEKEPFDSPDWSYELKLDGFRTLAVIKDGKVRLLSRRGQDATAQFAELHSLSTLTRAAEAVLDGEVVALDEAGEMSFSALQQRTGWKGGKSHTEAHPSIPIVYYVFDILHHDGLSVAGVPLRERRRLLAATLLDGPNVRLLDTFPGTDGRILFEVVKAQGQEGVVAKKLESTYHPGERSRSWLKIKAIRTQSLAVVGFSPPQGGRQYLGSLAVAVAVDGGFRYAGQVGSGFNDRLLRDLHDVLSKLALEAPPPGLAGADLAPKGVTWVRPEVVCEAKYNEWTRENVLRQPTFLRLRPDLVPQDCRREE